MAFGRGRLAGRQSIACHLHGGRGALGWADVSPWPAFAGIGPGAGSLVLPPSVPDGIFADFGWQIEPP